MSLDTLRDTPFYPETHGSVFDRDWNTASELPRVDLTDTRTSLPDHQTTALEAVIKALRAALPVLGDVGALVSGTPLCDADDVELEVRQALALAEAAGLARPNPTTQPASFVYLFSR
jgi:hypothetical protein